MAAMTAIASSCGGVAAAAAAAGAAAAAAASSGASTASAAVAGAAAAAASTAGASSAGVNSYNLISCIHGLCSLKRMRTHATIRLHACIDAVLLLNNKTTQ